MQKSITDMKITCHLFSFILSEKHVLSMFFFQAVDYMTDIYV